MWKEEKYQSPNELMAQRKKTKEDTSEEDLDWKYSPIPVNFFKKIAFLLYHNTPWQLTINLKASSICFITFLS